MRIEGQVSPRFEPVRKAFEENFSLRRELGGACCVYCRGEKVVDLWGGLRNAATSEPWEEARDAAETRLARDSARVPDPPVARRDESSRENRARCATRFIRPCKRP